MDFIGLAGLIVGLAALGIAIYGIRALDPKETVDSAQEFANNELLSLAQDYVSHGVATWKPDMDENTIREMVKSWRGDKNSQLLKSMFGKRHRSIL